MKVKSESEVAQSCPTLRDPMDCSLPGSSVHGIFQARVLEWGAIAFSVTWAQLNTNQSIKKKKMTEPEQNVTSEHTLSGTSPRALWYYLSDTLLPEGS